MYMKMVYQYMAIFFTFPTTSNHLHPLQVEVVDEDDNDKFRPEMVKPTWTTFHVEQNLLNFPFFRPNIFSEQCG